jgi:hypothetical protein
VPALLKPWLQEGSKCLVGMGSTSVSIQWDLVANRRPRSTYTEQEFDVFCTVHCDIIMQYKPKKCTVPKLIFLFLSSLCLLHILNPKVYLQEDGCMYSYGMVHFTCRNYNKRLL